VINIKKAVIPAAGLGTRMLPASKSMPKEMICLVDKPAIQYIVEEAASAGIEDILIILSRGKSLVEDHFDRSPELEWRLSQTGKESLLDQMTDISKLANICYVRQHEALGLGHAIYQAKAFVGDSPFAVLYGDDVVISKNPAIRQLCDAYEQYGLGVAGVKPVPIEHLPRYGSTKASHISGNHYTITDMIEKPPPGQEFSNLAILGRCVLPSEIFGILEKTPKGVGGEIQLTDAMRYLAIEKTMIGVEYEGTRYDMGNKLSYMQASVELALSHPEISAQFADYLKSL